MITRRSILIMLAGTMLSGRSRAQALVADDDTPVPLAFKVAPLTGGSDTEALALMATYGERDSETKFVIEIQAPDEKEGSGPISFSRGAFRHVPGSRPTRFFEQLAKALTANAPSLSNAKLETLQFGIAFLGAATARLPGGGFGGGKGDWYATKLFLAQDEAEVFFNFNLVSGEAEFSIKDEDYGNTVLSELSKVIW
ncbi:hypothetical protein [Rhizobium sp. ICMP 5592]|uniref:hypothetical protein n=1 Tax=Rhizobium sp. ICMP 5592 TaxID=2292445 RepID=UPI0012968FF4|nr:hypothetical protein [Rhizobium sp. ICMP 5592]MQB42947.1 hypothetical protein [Rhizobium sp. ICMP 5592]